MSYAPLLPDPLEGQHQVRQTLNKLDCKLDRAVRKGSLARAQADGLTAKLQDFQNAHPDLNQNSQDASAPHTIPPEGTARSARETPRLSLAEILLALGAVAGAWALDCILFAGVSRHFARSIWPSRWFEGFAQVVLPVVFVLIDLWISNLRRKARLMAIHCGGGTDQTFWTFIAVLFGLVMPCAVAATLLAAFGPHLFGYSIPLFIAMLLLSFVSHVVLLFGGRFIVHAVDQVSFDMRCWLLRRSFSRADQRRMTYSDAAVATIKDYHTRITFWNQNHKELAIEPHLFTAEVRDFINQLFGYQIIVPPDGKDTPPSGPGSPWSPSPPRASPAPVSSAPQAEVPHAGPAPDYDRDDGTCRPNGEVDYLRRVLRTRVRDEDSELRPDIKKERKP